MSAPSAPPFPEPLLVSLRRGEAAAWREAFVRLWPRAHRVALRVLADPHLAEDIAAEMLQDLARHPDRVRTWPELEAYALVATRRRAISLHRARLAAKRGGDRLIPFEENGDVPTDLAAPDTARDALELAELLQQLDPLRRQLVEAHYLHGETSQEIGRRLGLPAATVRSHLLRALQHLRRDLRSESRETAG